MIESACPLSRFCPALIALTLAVAAPQPRPVAVHPVWTKTVRENRTRLNIQVCPEPPMRRNSPIHKQILGALRDLKAEYNRFQPWFPYPKLTVAELEPPRDGKTYWDFKLLDELLVDFMEAADGRPVVVNLGPIPQWMFKTAKPVSYPDNPDEIVWSYSQGTELRDPSMKEVADYYARVAKWYIKGGFEDEYGRFHKSGHRFRFAYWEVLNEVDIEHDMSPEFYTAIYDKIVEAIRPVDPEMKFMGPALANPGLRPQFFHHFLDPKNHKPGIPVDMISYHFYSMPTHDEPPETWQYTMFAQADRFVDVVRHIDALRNRLRPAAGTYLNEIGSMLPDPQSKELKSIPPFYWNLSASMFAYIYIQIARMGIDLAAAAELIDYPGQFAATTLVHWETGVPNARYWVLKLLVDEFRPGDRLVETPRSHTYVVAQGFVTRTGERKALVLNQRDRSYELSIPGARGGSIAIIDQTTGSTPAARSTLKTDSVTLTPYAVAVITLPRTR